MTRDEFFRLVVENGPDEAPLQVPDEWYDHPGFQEACDRWEQKTAGGMRLPQFLEWVRERPFDQPPADTPPEWLRMSDYRCARGEWRDNIFRSVSKVGNIWVPTEGLRELAARIPLEEQLQLYADLVRFAAWREAEFRPDFERGFPEAAPLLPPPLRQEDRENAWMGAVRNALPQEDIPF